MSANPEKIQTDAIAAALLRLTVTSNPRELWGYDEIAAYSKLARNYVANVVVLQAKFPRPIRAVNEASHPRYVAGEVMDWFESRKEPLP